MASAASNSSLAANGPTAIYGFLLLGVLIEKVSGQSYYDYVAEHVYKPAGMTLTAPLTEDQLVPGRSVGGIACFGHGGGAPGMNDDLGICPGPGYVVGVLANLDPPAAQRVSDFVLNRLPEK